MDIATIRTRFKEASVPLGERDTWKVQQVLVIKHSALERLAAAASIAFDPPQVLRSEADECVIVVTGRMGDKVEWSIGEARIGLNYRVSGNQAGYPYAMAEKRAKDRVIIKLVGLHGVYSSEEADDFRKGDEPAPPAEPPSVTFSSGVKPEPGPLAKTLIGALVCAKTVEDLVDWGEAEADNIHALPSADAEAVRAAFKGHRAVLLRGAREAAE